MSSQSTLVASAAILTSLLGIGLAGLGWRRRATPGGLAFALLTLAAAEWAFTRALEALALGLEAKVMWAKVEYLGIASLPPLWLMFTLAYSGQGKRLTWRTTAVLWLIPLITLGMAATNERHRLLWSNIIPASTTPDAFLIYEHGAWFWIAVAYSYAAILAGTAVLAQAIVRFPNLYRNQALALLTGAAIPWIGNILYLARLGPMPGIDLTPFAFTLTGLIYALSIFRFQLFDLAPIAREAILDSLSEGIIVLDAQHRIADINPAARRFLGAATSPIGRPAEAVFARWPDLPRRYGDTFEIQEEVRTDDQPPRYLDLKISPLRDQRGRLSGRLITFRDITERKQAEVQLRLQSIALESAANGVVITDRQGNIIWANPAFTHITGYTLDEVRAQNPRLLKSGAHDAEFYQSLWQTILDGRIWRGELTNRRKDGSLYTEAQTIAPVRDERGEITHFIAIKHDITQRKQTEEALRQQNEYLAALNETMLGLSSRLDLNDILEKIVKRAGQLLGTPHGYLDLAEPGKAELTPKVATGALSQSIRFKVKPGEGAAGVVWQTGQPVVVGDYDTWAGRVKGFSYNTIRAVISVPLKSGSRVVGALGLAYDSTTDQTFGPEAVELLSQFGQLAAIALDNAWLFETERAARQQAETLRAATQALSATLNLQQVLEIILRELRQVVPYDSASVQQLKGRQLEIIACHGFENTADVLGAKFDLDDADAPNIQVVRRRVPAILVDAPAVSARFRAGLNASAGIHGWLGVPMLFGDRVIGMLTLDKREPGFYTATFAQLAMSFAAQAAIAIENARLFEETQKARDAAEAATRAKSEFLANMSHEIRTPMNAVVSTASLLLDTPLTAQQRKYVETIQHGGETLLYLVNDILDFSKIEAGRLELERRPFDLRECLESVLTLMATQAADKGLHLAYLIEGSAPQAIWGDVTRLQQILTNLLSNAIKFTDEGEVSLVVSSAPVPGGGAPVAHELDFSVKDTGIGIPPERQHRLFQSFSQVDASTTRNYGGTGLGLVISKRLCELMGGRMWVESEGVPGEGSTFHFSLTAEAAPLSTRLLFHAAEQPCLKGKRLLIVDQSATSRRSLQQQAQAWGMAVQTSASAAETLVALQVGQAFDAVVLDLRLLQTESLALTQALWDETGTPRQPLILLAPLSGAPAPDATQFTASLTKPVRQAQFYSALVRALAGETEAQNVEAALPARRGFDAQMAQSLPLRILVVEDNAINQAVTLEFLARLGYRADVASSGLEALAALKKQPYNVALMDVQMPEIDGPETTRRLRAIEKQLGAARPRTRVIAITANASQDDRATCLAAGMDDYISKPMRVRELRRALERAARTNGPAGPSQAAEVHRLGATLDEAVLTRLGQTAAFEKASFLAKLTQIYNKEATQLLAAMRQAFANREAAKLKLQAHTLKGASGNVGARQMQAICAALEAQGKSDAPDWETVQALLAQADGEYARLRQALEDYLAQGDLA